MMPQIREIFEFRGAVEKETARLAAMRRTDRHLAQLTAAYQEMERELETSHFRAADSQFHLGIAEAAGNGWMRDAVEKARTAVWLPADPLYEHVFRSAHVLHGPILDAVRGQQPDQASQLMAEHIQATVEDLERIAAAAVDAPVR
jgi:DNA-binding GntR family transcriptional regulator